MGLHDVCRNRYHGFDKGEELVMEYDPRRGCHLLWGVCSVCGRIRIIYTDELKEPSVIDWKLCRDGYSKTEHDVYFSKTTDAIQIYTE